MQTRRLIPLALVVALAALLAWVLLRPATQTPATQTPGPDPAAPGPDPAAPDPAPTAADSARHARTWRSGARTPVPRAPSRARRPDAGAPSPAPEVPAEAGPIDRREHPPADAAQTRDAIWSRLDDVEADIETCLDAWRAEDPDLEGTVNMGFQIDASGLQQAFVVDHSDVPLGPLSCFSAAIGDVDWSELSSEPVEITFPFEISSPSP